MTGFSGTYCLAKFARNLCLAAILLAGGSAFSAAYGAELPFNVNSTQVLLYDSDTGSVLFSRQADAPFAPASLAKLMTAEIVFNALKNGKLQPDKAFTVSEHAWRTGGAPSGTATMFAKLNSQITVYDLLQGIIVQSANDGAIILAEGMSGSEQNFAKDMNRRASELGLKNSVFANATGLPSAEAKQQVTLSDMVRLAQHIQQDYPQYYPLYAQESFSWNKIFQRNRNPLLRLDIGADGLAMGGTKETGMSFIASAQAHGRRIFLGLNGAKTAQDRSADAEKLINWAMNDFIRFPVFEKETEVAQAALYGGTQGSVGLIVRDRVSVLVPAAERGKLHAQVIYQGPVAAPVKKGQEIGRLQVLRDKEILLERPVFAAQDVVEGTLRNKSLDALYELATGWMRRLW
ncbi:D-alanyl-D-alanine carboxypeptidase family protein [Pseudochrobactrum sp. HB0163]|uniref:D-alanyl-D-alanine carboxypeptidase family protein n=1 Tax=Pseudochrobactrum sp. HB0163 TaxID=3450708 RepID=UPI003F6DAE24